MKRIIAAMLVALACLGARATTFSTDATDLWFNVNEQGWGLNVIQQDDILFATLFVYGGDNQPRWYVGSDLRYSHSDASGGLVFTGIWYRTTGPYFVVPFNPNLFNVYPVGTATFTLNGVNSATFTYSVDNVVVSKNVTRQTWATNWLAGIYVGATVADYANCDNPADNGYYEDSAVFTVTQSGSTVTIVQAAAGFTCTFTGTYEQHGRLGELSGNATCGSVQGTFQAHQIEASVTALAGHIQFRNGCTVSGRFGGVRRMP
jgi:hypothetical protein